MDERLISGIDSRIASLMGEAGMAHILYDMMRYHFGWLDEQLGPASFNPGKRIRPRLCFLACAATGAAAARAMAPAAAVELVHNFSLVHDDIQDRSHFRRHRRTVWDIWGDAQAINVGDGLLVLAQMAITDDPETDAERRVRGLAALNRACRLLCEGQYLDMDYERRPVVSREQYYTMIERKTGALLEASCLLGALYGDANDGAIVSYGSFGRYLGLAFQVQDDYLGIWGDPKETGKPAADDLISKKKALPLVHLIETASGPDLASLEPVLSSPDPATPEQVSAILDLMDRYETVAFVAAEVERNTRLALDALGSANPAPPFSDELASLCNSLTIRRS